MREFSSIAMSIYHQREHEHGDRRDSIENHTFSAYLRDIRLKVSILSFTYAIHTGQIKSNSKITLWNRFHTLSGISYP